MCEQTKKTAANGNRVYISKPIPRSSGPGQQIPAGQDMYTTNAEVRILPSLTQMALDSRRAEKCPFGMSLKCLARRRRPPVALMTKKTVGGISEFPPPNKTSSFSSSRLVLRLDRRHRALLQRRPPHRRFCARAPICPLSPHLHPFCPARSALANNGHSICRRLFRDSGHFGGSSPPPPLTLTRSFVK